MRIIFLNILNFILTLLILISFFKEFKIWFLFCSIVSFAFFVLISNMLEKPIDEFFIERKKKSPDSKLLFKKGSYYILLWAAFSFFVFGTLFFVQKYPTTEKFVIDFVGVLGNGIILFFVLILTFYLGIILFIYRKKLSAIYTILLFSVPISVVISETGWIIDIQDVSKNILKKYSL